MIGRLKPGVTRRQAEVELTTLLQAYNQEILRDPEAESSATPGAGTLAQQYVTLLDGSAGLSNAATALLAAARRADDGDGAHPARSPAPTSPT